MGRGEQVSPAGPRPAPGRQTAGPPRGLHSSGPGSGYSPAAPWGGQGDGGKRRSGGPAHALRADRRAFSGPPWVPSSFQHLSSPLLTRQQWGGGSDAPDACVGGQKGHPPGSATVEAGRGKEDWSVGPGTMRMRRAAGSGGTVDALFLTYHLWTLFEAFLEFVTILFFFTCFLGFFKFCVFWLQGLWDLSSHQQSRPHPAHGR